MGRAGRARCAQGVVGAGCRFTVLTPTHATLVADLRQLIAEARSRAATAVNAELTALYWQVGRRIHVEILGRQRTGYGEEVVSALGRQLTADCGRGFSAKNLHHMLRFAQAFPDEATVSALQRQLSWTHLKALIYLDDPLKREFYIELCRLEGAGRGLHLRGTAEAAADRQRRLLHRPAALQPQAPAAGGRGAEGGEFRAEFKGQMELYLRWLAKHGQEPGENPPLGIILCAGKKQEQIELLELDKSGIHVAEYLTVLLPRETLQAKLHQSITNARQRLLQADKGDT